MKCIVPLAAAALMSAGAAFAQDASTVRVSFADLDLNHASGRQALQQRIEAAVDRVCPNPGIMQLNLQPYVRGCRQSAMAGAQHQLASLTSHPELAQASVTVSAPRK